MRATWPLEIKHEMDAKEFFEILGIFWLSAIKFGLAGVPTAVFAKFSFFKAITVTSCGGFTGTVVFTYLFDWAIRSAQKMRQKYRKTPRKNFTTTNRFIVKVKQKFGLTGLAIITPLILSIPLGCFVAVRYFENKRKIVTYMFVSIFTQSIILFLFYNYFYNLIF